MDHKRKDKYENQRGYTLTELLVVLVIIAMLTGLVAPRLIGRVGKAKSTTARTQIENLVSALDIYNLDMDEYPSNEQGLSVLVKKPDDQNEWQGPYLRRGKVPLDPWKRAYIYHLSEDGGATLITSLGKDGQIGGEGDDRDITSND